MACTGKVSNGPAGEINIQDVVATDDTGITGSTAQVWNAPVEEEYSTDEDD